MRTSSSPGMPKVRRHHPDNAIGCAVQADIFTGHMRVAGEQVLPQAFGEDRDLLLAEDGLLFGERTPQQRPHAQHLEERRRHFLPLDALRGSLRPDFVARTPDERHFAEDVGHLAAVQVIGDAVRAAVDAHAGVEVVHRHQPLGLRERQPPQNHVLEDRENGGIGADREGQRQQRRGRESALLEQKFETEDEVLKHSGASWSNTQTHPRVFRPAKSCEILAGWRALHINATKVVGPRRTAHERRLGTSACLFRGQHGQRIRLHPRPIRAEFHSSASSARACRDPARG